MSFRWKTILGIAVIESVLLTIIVISSVSFLRTASIEDMIKQGHTASSLFSSAIEDAVLTHDLASLQSTVEELLENPQIRYVRIYDLEHILVEEGEEALLAQPFSEDTKFMVPNDGVYDVAAQIMVAGYNFGHVEIGFDTRTISARINAASTNISIIATMELLLCALFSFLLGTYLTHQLASLRLASHQLEVGNFGFQVKAKGRDELGVLALSFNKMSKRIKHLMDISNSQYNKLQEREKLFNTLLKSAPYGVLIGNHQRKVEYTNSAFINLLNIKGKNPKSIISKECDDILPMMAKNFPRQEVFFNFVYNTLLSESKRLNYSINTNTGKSLEIDYIPIRISEEEERIYHLWFFRDVSERNHHKRGSSTFRVGFPIILNFIAVLYNAGSSHGSERNPHVRAGLASPVEIA